MKLANKFNGEKGIIVASLAEAWIETYFHAISPMLFSVASLEEAWIETAHRSLQARFRDRRLPRGGVD